MLKLFDVVSQTTVTPLISLNLTQKYHRDLQPELHQHRIKFHPDQLKGVQKNEAKMLSFALTLWPQCKVRRARKWSQNAFLCVDLVIPMQGQGQWKWSEMLKVNGAYKHERYEKRQKNMHVVSTLKIFATPRRMASLSDGRTEEHGSLHRAIWYSYGSKMKPPPPPLHPSPPPPPPPKKRGGGHFNALENYSKWLTRKGDAKFV